MTAFAPPPLFFEAHYGTEPDPTISYRTALTVYEESFIKGRLVGRGWNGAGFLNFYDGRFDPAQHAAPQAFWLEVDGQLLASDWEWIGFEKTKNGAHCTITLKPSVSS